MKKTRILLVVLLALFVGFLTACTSTDDLLNAAKDELVANYADTIASETYQVTGNLDLVTEIGDATVSWTSSNTAIITTAGVVTRPEANTLVTLTATLTIKGETLTHQFRVTVKAVDLTVAQRLAAAKALLVTNYANTIGNNEYVVMANLALVTTIGEATVSWATSDASIITTAGVVTRPSFAVGDQTVTLTATLTISGQTTTQIFYAFVQALDETVAERLDRALAFATTFPAVEGITGAETWLEFPTSIVFEEQTYTVSWVSDKPDFLAIDGTVTRPVSGAANETVIMTATITEGTTTRSMEVEFVVFAYESSKLLDSIADIYAEEAGTYVKFEGVTVIGKMTAGFFISDGTTMLYIYDSSTLYNNVVIGQVYDIEGVYGLYFNAPQLANDATRPLTATASTATPASMNGTPSTVAEAIGDKLTPSGSNLMVYDYLAITGKIVVDSRETVDVGRYNTFLVDTTFTGTEVIKTLASGKATEYNTPAIVIYYQSPNKAAVEALNGKEVTINILLYGWRTDRNIWYAVYLGDGTDIEVAFATDAEAVAAVKTALTLPLSTIEATTFTLPTTQYGASISWASSNETVINPTTGVVTPIAGQQVTVTLTATITKNAATDTKVFTIKVGVPGLSTIRSVYEMADGATIKVRGILTAKTKTDGFWMQDSTAGINIYTSGAFLTQLQGMQLGVEIEIVGELDIFNGLREVAYIQSITVINNTPVAVTPVSINDVEFNNTALLEYQGQLVSLTGFLLKTDVNATTSSFNFTLYEPVSGKQINARVESSAPGYADIIAFLNPLAVNAPVNLSGVIVGWYNTYQLAITGANNFALGVLSDAQKVALDAAALSIAAAMTEAGTLTLPATGTNGSAIAWTSNNALIDASTGAVSMPVSGQVTVTLTATLTLNTTEKVVTFDILLGTSSAPEVFATDLFISEYLEGSSNNKAIEIYNGTGVTVDLSIYKINLYANGSATATGNLALTGTLAHGEVYVIYNSSAVQAIKDVGDISSTVTFFNGDDALALLKNDVVIDVFGVIGTDPGASWAVGTDTTVDHTLVRAATVTGPSATWDPAQWVAYDIDTLTYLGSHTMTGPQS